MIDRRILPLDAQVDKTEPDTIPKIPFTMNLVGQKSAGKTTLLLNLICKNFFYKNKFNRVIWISPTNALDPKVEVLKTTKGIVKPNKKLEKLKKSSGQIPVREAKLRSLLRPYGGFIPSPTTTKLQPNKYVSVMFTARRKNTTLSLKLTSLVLASKKNV